MSSVLDYRQCPQCRYERADSEFNCRTYEEHTNCQRCGFSEYVEREKDSEGTVAFTHRVIEGAGVLFYRWKGGGVYTYCCLGTQEEVARAERWLREKLAAGEVRAGSAYVTRWDKEANAVKVVIGHFFEISGYDPDDELPEPEGPSDLRQFQLIESIRGVRVRHSCNHILDGRIVLLGGQAEPQRGELVKTVLPCLSCLPKYLGEIDRIEQCEAVRQRRTGLWEYRSSEAKDGRVMPAFDHPKTLQEAASMLYSSHPDRKRFFPDCDSALRLQLRGVRDEEIIVTYWYAEHAGTRGLITADDFVTYLSNGNEGFAAKLRKQGFTEVHMIEPSEIEAAREKVSQAPGDWGGSWKMTYPWETRSWQRGK